MTHNNPLIAKWEEIYGQKENPELTNPDYYKGEKSYAEELRDTYPISVTTPQGTAPLNLNNFIQAKNASTGFKTYDIDSVNDSFLQIAEKVKNKNAQVISMSMGKDIISKETIITFEVRVELETL